MLVLVDPPDRTDRAEMRFAETVRVGYRVAVPLLVMFAILGLFSVTGTGSDGSSTAPDASPTRRSAGEQAYLQTARLHGVVASDPSAFDTARNVCADLNSGGDVDRVASYVARRDVLGDADARTVLRAAVRAYCPNQQNRAG